ncbi:hypothetical protein COU57_04925 [Candidatus Pacearchaeota archaeon CG10_big_fil_rev_8_21_14_0_10_32_14]|nr:MAG: hypothetical protein COU57_04925 [Candidatus Pacearchaeota archaeon CG10_big_fil_rev_8_21_14_0_10_32_14]
MDRRHETEKKYRRPTYPINQRRYIEHNVEHVDDPKRKFPDKFNLSAYIGGLQKYIGEDFYGDPGVDFFRGTVDD